MKFLSSEKQKEMEEQLNQMLSYGQKLNEIAQRMRRIGFIAIWVGVVAAIVLIDTIFW